MVTNVTSIWGPFLLCSTNDDSRGFAIASSSPHRRLHGVCQSLCRVSQSKGFVHKPVKCSCAVWGNAVKVCTLYVTFFANIGPTYVKFIPISSVQLVDCRYLIMVALCNRTDHYYYFHAVSSSSSFFFFFLA